jgi:putative YpdA family bacillithiol system oxidoreductase
MAELLTTLAFVGISILLVVRHVRRTAARPGPSRACARCGAAMPAEAALCPACGVPAQAYELVQAPLAPKTPAAAAGPLHALVRTDLCVGCGTCVGACPEPGALRLVEKIATVDLDRCKGHGSCAAACPVGAIVVTSGAAVQRVEVPAVSADFETNVPGLYVVGELGGRGLIKNAINEGKIAVEHVARSVAAERGRDAEADVLDLVIAGSGPAGLSAALEAQRRGLRYLVLEQGTLADSIRKYPRQKLLLAEPVRTPLYGDLWVSDASKETLLEIWQNVIARRGLKIETGERVERVEREIGGFRITTPTVEYRARRVVLALGRRGTPRRLGVPGEDLDKVFYDIIEMEAFAGRRVLVVGGGDSAVESALGLANQPGTAVTLSYRGAEFARIKDRNRAKLERATADGRVRVWLESQVKEIRPDVVAVEHQGRFHLEPNDVVIVRIGGEAPFPFLERCGVRIVSKEIALEPAASAG